MDKRELKKQQERIDNIKEAWRIFADAINYDDEKLIRYCNLTKAIYVEINDGDILLSRLIEMLKTLTPREKEMLEYRFGLSDYEPMTFQKIGDVYGLSKERVRQIILKALRKLRHPKRTARITYLRDRKIKS